VDYSDDVDAQDEAQDKAQHIIKSMEDAFAKGTECT
jgi:hypothetical protein